jgi:hypothetical protein
MSIPYQITTSTLTFYVGSRPYQVDRSVPTFEAIVAELKSPQADPVRLVELADVAANVQRQVDEAEVATRPEDQYLVRGVIKVDRSGVTYNGDPIDNSLSQKLIDILSVGLPIAPWVRFAENLYQNPAEHAREELYDWLAGSDLPITEDGHFFAYKIVDSQFRDLRTGTFDNSPGQLVELENREAVDPVRDRTCSRGLHFCSKSYLPHFGYLSGGNRVVIVKVNPADVVSIPSDYQFAKGRTWRYEVIQEVPAEEIEDLVWAPIWTAEPDVEADEYDVEEYDDDIDEDLDEDLEDLEEDEDTVVLEYQPVVHRLEEIATRNERAEYLTALNKLSLRELRRAGSKAGLGSAAWKTLKRQAITDYLVEKAYGS